MSRLRVCVVGGGGREHALAAVLGRDADVIVTPGNPGMAAAGVAVTAAPAEELAADLFVVGPEDPLVNGLADRLRARGRLVFGPGADGARLEGSKVWMKQVLAEAGVPTASHASFGAAQADAAEAFLRAQRPPYVVKTDGLAAGKGVLVTGDLAEAIDDVRAKLAGRAFGKAGSRVVIEEGMTGPEVSVLAVCDGRRAVPLAPAQDHKRIRDGDEGPNTGGMGAYSPVPVVDDEIVGQVMDRAVEPTLAALRSKGIDYRGVLYAGLMLTDAGPRVLEFNVRFGDPEAQVVLPRLAGSLTDLLGAAAAGDLSGAAAAAGPTAAGPTAAAGAAAGADAAVCVVAASEGYPESPTRLGTPIDGVEVAGKVPGVTVFYAGVGADSTGRLVTAGGRVLAVTALGPDLAAARQRAYEGMSHITFAGMQYRRDIARTALEMPR